MNLLVFDIETIPDLAAGRRLYELSGLSDADTAAAMFLLRRDKTGQDFLPPYLQKIIAISVVLRTEKKLAVWSLGEIDSDEKDLITRFYDGIDRYTPTLVSWNGSSFDLPVLHYRTLLHKISAPCYWKNGSADTDFRYNNYLSRYHERHTDLMDVLAGYQARCYAPLNELAKMLGFPGKMGMDGDKVWDAYQAGQLVEIRNYCETDVLNTYLIYLRYQLMRGKLSLAEMAIEEALLRDTLLLETKAHLTKFLQSCD